MFCQTIITNYQKLDRQKLVGLYEILKQKKLDLKSSHEEANESFLPILVFDNTVENSTVYVAQQSLVIVISNHNQITTAQCIEKSDVRIVT